MALDPSVSLQVNTNPNLGLQGIQGYLGIARGVQDIAASKQAVEASKAAQALTEQQTANAAAENPGIAADAAVKKRAADANAVISELGPKYVTKQMVQDKLTDGTPALDAAGKPVMKPVIGPDGNPILSVNHVGLANELAQRGFYKESQGIAATDLDNAAKGIKNATDQQDQAIKTAEFTTKATQHVSQLLQNAPPETRGALLDNYVQYADKLVPGSGTQIALTFTGKDPKTGVPIVDHDRVKAVYDGAMSALDAGNLAVAKTNAATAQANAATSREAVAQTGVTGLSGSAYRGVAPSPEEIAFATQNGFPYNKGMDRATLYHLPGYQEAYQSRVVSGAEKAAAQGAVTESQAAVARYNQAQSAVAKLQARGLLDNTGTIGSQLSNLTSRMGNDPDVRAALAAVQGLNDPSVNPEALSSQAMMAIMSQKAATAQATANVAGAPLKAVTHDQIQPAQVSAAQPKAAQTGTVKMVATKGPNKGKVHEIPANLVDEARSQGFIAVGGK